MYSPMQNRLPAPYEVNSFRSPYESMEATHPMYSAMKRGGRAKTSGYTTVHMNPHEISIMEHLQGHSRYNKDGVKEFKHLEEILKNPHILHGAHHHARMHHADGGPTHEEIEHLRQGGRFGDSTLASIGPQTMGFFNHLAGHPTINPYTGHHEFWSLGGALKGLWGAVKGGAKLAAPALKSVAQHALPTVLPMAQQALASKFGGAGQMAGQALGAAANHAIGSPEGPSNPYHEALGNAIGKGFESYRGGASPTQAFGQGVQSLGSNLGGGIGGAMEGMGRSIGAGNGVRNTLKSGMHSGFNAMGGRQGLTDMASNVAQGFGTGGFGGARTAARQQMTDYRNRAMPQLQAPANQDYEPYPEYPAGQEMASY